MYFWLFYAIWLLETYFLWLSMEMMLTFRIGKNKWIQAAVVTLAYAAILYFKLKTTGTNGMVYKISLYSGDVFICLYVVLLHKESMLKKFMAFMVTLLGCMITTLLFEHILYLEDGSYGFDFDSVRGLKAFMANNGFAIAIITFMTVAYRSFIHQYRIKNGLAIALFAVNQIAMILFFFSLDSLEGYSYANIVSTAGIACGYLADLLLFLVVDRQAEQERVYRRVQKLQKEMELEAVKYEAMRERRGRFAKLRHDYNNQLTTVQLLLKSGKEDEAYRLANELKSLIDGRECGR